MADEKTIEKLVSKLYQYREAYYSGEPLISDELFDFKEQELRELDPNNKYFTTIGNNRASDDGKIEHKIPMLSMQKVKTAQEAAKWFFNIIETPGLFFEKSLAPQVWVEPKLDGVSGKIVYDKDGNFLYAANRGDGRIGNIIPIAKRIASVPKQFIPNSEIRGEFIIPKRHKKHFKNRPLRNICSGILKRIDDLSDDIKFVEFVIYDAFAYDNADRIEFKDRGEKIKKITSLLAENNDNFIVNNIMKTINIEDIYNKYVNEWRDMWLYETDGIILTIDGGEDNYHIVNSKYIITNCNRYNMALKPPAEYAETTIINIDVAVNRTKLSFIAEVEPVYINGVLIKRASLHEYRNMVSKKIGIGTRVLLKRSNDVIPMIVEAFNPEGVDIKYIQLSKCPVCKTKLVRNYGDLMCPNEYGCVGVFKSKLAYLLNSLKIKNIGPAIIDGVVEHFYNTNLELKLSTFIQQNLEKDGDYPLSSFINEFYNGGKRPLIYRLNINKIFDGVTEIDLLSGFNIPSIAKAELVKRGIRTFKDFTKYIRDLEKDEKVIFDSAFDTILYNWSRDENNMDDINKTYKLMKPYFIENVDHGGTIITYCISGEIPGMTRADIIKYLSSTNKNLIFVPNITTRTNYLISEQKNTAKVMRAIKYNIPIVTLSEMVKKFK